MFKGIIAALMLAGCSPTLVSGNEAGGIVGMNAMMSGQSKAMETANTECKKYGKVAKPAGVNEIRNSMRYDCVAP